MRFELLDIFVPNGPGTYIAQALLPGSAMVGRQNQFDHVRFYFEGAARRQYASYEECLHCAAHRLVEEIPTIAHMSCKREDIVKVGLYEPEAQHISLLLPDLLKDWVKGSFLDLGEDPGPIVDKVYPLWERAAAFKVNDVICGTWRLADRDAPAVAGAKDVLLSLIVPDEQGTDQVLNLDVPTINQGAFSSDNADLAITRPDDGALVFITPLFPLS